MWVAKMKIANQVIDEELSPRFNSALECLDFIKKNLVILEYLVSEMQTFIDLHIREKICFRFGSYIRPYNLEQDRFIDGFDL